MTTKTIPYIMLLRWEGLVKTAKITKSPLLPYYKYRMNRCLDYICSIQN